MKRILGFNNFFYESCFFNCFFSICEFYSIGVHSFLENDIYCYINDNGFGYKVKRKDTFEDIVKKMNIKYHSEICVENVVENIKTAIDNNELIIIYIDYFYETIRLDVSGKEHGKHTILIYDYDENNQQIMIIEHKDKDSLLYKEQVISFKDVEKSHQSYIDNIYPEVRIESIHYFSLDQSINLEVKVEDRILIKSNFELFENDIIKGLAIAEDYLCGLDGIIRNEKILKKNLESTIKTLNGICNMYQVEQFRNQYFFDEDIELKNSFMNVYNKWNKLRNIIVKYQYMPRTYSEEFVNRLSIILSEIPQNLREYNHMFYRYLCRGGE